jgi:hypothetical protein
LLQPINKICLLFVLHFGFVLCLVLRFVLRFVLSLTVLNNFIFFPAAAAAAANEASADGAAGGSSGDDDVRGWEVVGNTETAATSITGSYLTSSDKCTVKSGSWKISWLILDKGVIRLVGSSYSLF